MFRRRYRGGGATRRVRRITRLLRRRAIGGGKKGPADQYIYTFPTSTLTPPANLADYIFGKLWLPGDHIATLLTNIRNESQFTLTGGAFLYQPTLRVSGFAEFDFVNTGNSDLHIEFIVFNAPRRNGTNTVAGIASTFASAWATSFDARPTNFEFFSDTSLLQNYSFWDRASLLGFVPSSRRTFKVGVGRPKRFTFRFKTRTVRYEDYAQGTMLTDGFVSGRTHYYALKVRGERGQACGVDVASGLNKPVLAELGGAGLFKHRAFYRYRWLPGNNRPTVYGANINADETCAVAAQGWVGVPSQKAQRFAWNPDGVVTTGPWGGSFVNTKQEVNINPAVDCVGDQWEPSVSVIA